MARAIKRRTFRSRDKPKREIPKAEAFEILSKADKKGRRAIRRVVLHQR